MSGVGSISCARGSVNKFRGALVGALIGDCLGSHYEGISCVIPWGEVVDYTGNRIKTNTEQLRYTDDSAMTRAVCRSLIQKQGYDNRAMAKEFVEEYFRDSERGYGAAVGTVFQRLKDEQPEDVTQPARLQFEGQGSYGNGAAMRISPLALFGLNSSEVQEVRKVSLNLLRWLIYLIDLVVDNLLKCFLVKCFLCSPLLTPSPWI